MTIKALVLSGDPNKSGSVNLGDETILSTLGQEQSVAVQMNELFTAVTESITASLEVESQLTLEITGSISLKAEGSTKYLFFNVGASGEASGSMKVTLSTTLKPKFESKTEKTKK